MRGRMNAFNVTGAFLLFACTKRDCRDALKFRCHVKIFYKNKYQFNGI